CSKVACSLTFPWMMSLSVVAWGVAGPASSGLGGVAAGGVVVVAEGLGDDGGGGLEDALAQGGGERGAGGNAELAGPRGRGGRVRGGAWSLVSARRSRPRRRCWVMGVPPGAARTGGRVIAGRWPALMAQVRKARAAALSPGRQVACQASMRAWLRLPGARCRPP